MFLYGLIYACIKIQRASNYQKVQLTNLVVNEIQMHNEKIPLNCPELLYFSRKMRSE